MKSGALVIALLMPAAAWAQSGYYLMQPPVRAIGNDPTQISDVPLRDWEIKYTFESADQCRDVLFRARKSAQADRDKVMTGRVEETPLAGDHSWEAVKWASAATLTQLQAAACVWVGDPRLGR